MPSPTPSGGVRSPSPSSPPPSGGICYPGVDKCCNNNATIKQQGVPCSSNNDASCVVPNSGICDGISGSCPAKIKANGSACTEGPNQGKCMDGECQLTGGAVCYNPGECCSDQLVIMEQGKPCTVRDAECYSTANGICDGKSESCPAPTVANNTPCNDGTGKCQNGFCEQQSNDCALSKNTIAQCGELCATPSFQLCTCDENNRATTQCFSKAELEALDVCPALCACKCGTATTTTMTSGVTTLSSTSSATSTSSSTSIVLSSTTTVAGDDSVANHLNLMNSMLLISMIFISHFF